MIGEVGGRYRIERPIGEGGMARVWLARQTGDAGFEKLVVLKTVLPHLARCERFDAMFRDEARIAADLRHPNVVQLLDAGLDADGHFMAIELLEGVDGHRLLRSFSRRKEPMPLEVVMPVITDAAHGLAYVHEKRDLEGHALGIVHRDISPSNLFVTLAGVTKVLDFGVAHARNQVTVTEAGVLKGKSAYMSPEQILGDPIDHRSDQYALAVVAVELLTGRRVFERENDVETLRAVLEGDPTLPDLLQACAPAPVVDAIVRALSFDRERRFASCAEFAVALERASRAIGLHAGRATLRDAVARAMEDIDAAAPPRAPSSDRRPVLRDIDPTLDERPTAMVPTPPAIADASWARARAADLARDVAPFVIRAVSPRSHITDAERDRAREAGRVARQLVHLRERGAVALCLAVASEIADENDDPTLMDAALAQAMDATPVLRARALELAGDRRKADGDSAGARDRYLQALALSGDDPAFSSLLERNLADLALDDRELTRAELHARRASGLARAVASRFALARAVFSLARIELRRGHIDAAELLLDQAARVLAAEKDDRFLARVAFERALICEVRGDLELAASLLESALAVHVRVGDALFAGRARENLAALDSARHALASA